MLMALEKMIDNKIKNIKIVIIGKLVAVARIRNN